MLQRVRSALYEKFTRSDVAALPKITLDQWRTLVAVVEAGGYAQAADQLHKSQSTLTYAVQKL
ncbi:MAG: LysR family transcriptional regulator, partial [Methylotetracoccus sp.]|nr:LysR family transcriptional regulator [Methylotetracoccus sp.]